MGVLKLNVLLRKYTQTATETVPYSNFKGQTWAIDASSYCYKFCYNAKNKKRNSHIAGFYELFYKLYRNGINPILIFDGKAPELKAHTILRRKARKILIEEKIEELQNSKIMNEEVQDQIQELHDKIIKFSDTLYTDIMHLCDLMNVPYKRSVTEADILCANLYKIGIVQAVLSEDTDMLMYGIEHVMCRYSYSDVIDHVNLNIILRELNITNDLFIDLCILCGTDYNVSHCGPETALKLILSHMSIEDICSKYPLPDKDYFDFVAVRHMVKNVHIYSKGDGDLSMLSLKYRLINWQQLKQYMHTNCNYRLTTIDGHCGNVHLLTLPKVLKVSKS